MVLNVEIMPLPPTINSVCASFADVFKYETEVVPMAKNS